MARLQSENRVSCHVTVGVGVTGIDVSSTVTMQDKERCCCHTNEKTWNNPRTEQMTSNVCACVTKLSLNNASCSPKVRRNKTTQTCGACDTCKHKGKGELNHQSVSNSTCLGHGSESVKQMVEWSTRAPRGRHIRMSPGVPEYLLEKWEHTTRSKGKKKKQ